MGGRRPSFNYSQIDPQIREMYDDEGLSLNEIASRLQIYPMQVKRRLISMGIEVRDRTEAVALYHRLHRGSVRKPVGPKRAQSKKKKGKVNGSKKKAKKHSRGTEEASDGGGGSGRKKSGRSLRRRRFRRSKG